MKQTFIEQLTALLHACNDSVNLLAFGLVIASYHFPEQLAGMLVTGAIGLMGGKALTEAKGSRRASDFQPNGNGNASPEPTPEVPDAPKG